MKGIVFEDCVRVNTDLFFVDSRYNIIYKMDIEREVISIVGSIPEESLLSNRLVGSIVYVNGCLFFAPMNAKKLWKMKLSSNEWKGYEIRNIETYPFDSFFQSIVFKNKLYLIGCEYPAIVVLDLLTDEMEYVEAPYEHLQEPKKNNNDCYFRCDNVLVDNCLYLATCVSNEILKFNLDTYEFSFIRIGDDSNRFVGIAFDGNWFCLAPRKTGSIVFWNGENMVNAIDLPDQYNNNSRMIFGGICYQSDSFCLPAVFEDNSIVLRKEGEEYCPQLYSEKYLFYRWIDSDTMVYVSYPHNMMLSYKGNAAEYKLVIDDKLFDNHFINNSERVFVSTQATPLIEDDVDLKLFIELI